MYRPISYLIANAIETVPPISASLLKSTEIYNEINRIAQDLHLMLCFSFFSSLFSAAFISIAHSEFIMARRRATNSNGRI